MNASDPSLKLIFGAALEQADGFDRVAYLDGACRDRPALRQQVEALLQVFDEADRFLTSTPGPEPAEGDEGAAPAPPDGSTFSLDRSSLNVGPGARIGPYKIVQRIGEGGMGVVFMAEQTKPVRRKVALKIIKPGMDSDQVIARFEAERQALALMDHPNIARVLDVGATATGHPYFVMELVRGVPITDYCDKNHLSPLDRLELFLPVCRAIQHAHQKGIIHRDIKPSNVLITLQDGNPEPKVIDFGVAKAIDQRLTERSVFTEFGVVVGTLEYMSPEQAEMGALDIDTRSDIYSLGVLLYELLTGSTPLERAKLRDAAYSEVLRRIREEDPCKPSTRLINLPTPLPSISAQRRMEPSRLSKLIRGDLDWIVMKALEKDRTRRYESASGFARDVQRYLDGDAVEACPPSATYLLRKFARKHRTALLTIGSFGALLLAGAGLSLGLAVWANKERVRAIRAEGLARVLQARAQDREQTAIEAVKHYGEVVRDTAELKNNPTLAPLRKTLLIEPYSFFQTLHDRLQANPEPNTESLTRLAAASFELGALSIEIGAKERALRSFEQSRSIWTRLHAGEPANRRLSAELARAEYQVATLLTEQGHSAEALVRFEQCRSIREDLLETGPMTVLEQADLALTNHGIGNLEKQLNHPTRALEAFDRALPIWERLVRADPTNIRYQGDFTWALTTIGTLRHDPARLEQALQAYQAARPLRQELARANPKSSWYQLDLAANQFNMGALQVRLGKKPEAMATFEEVRPIWQELTREDQANPRYAVDLAWTWLQIGELRADLGQAQTARDAFDQARSI